MIALVQPPKRGWSQLLWAFLILSLPLGLGGWRELAGGINRHYVARIQDGKTKKAEILVWFGDPHEVRRTPEGVTYIYRTYRTKRPSPGKDLPEVQHGMDTPYHLEEKLKAKLARPRPTQEVASTLTIRFAPDGDTVISHEYREF